MKNKKRAIVAVLLATLIIDNIYVGQPMLAATDENYEESDGAETEITPTPSPDPDMLTPQEQEMVNTFGVKKVTGVKCTVDIQKKTKLKWKKLNDASSYTVYRATKKSGEYKKIATVNKNTYTDKKTKARKKYYYKIEGNLIIREREFICNKSKIKSVYVRPKKPRTVVAGECFVQDFVMIKKDLPKNFHFVYKIGVNTYSMQHNNYFTYKGRTITGIERVATYKPDRVYFLIGANEVAWAGPKWSIKNFDRMYKLLKKVNKNVQIVLIAVPPFGWRSRLNIPSVSKRARHNKGYKVYANKHKNVYYCDATNVLADSSSHLMRKYDAGDGCHWNLTGARAVAARMKKWSKKTFHNW